MPPQAVNEVKGEIIMEGIKGFFTSIITLQGIIAVAIALVLCFVIFFINKKRGRTMSTKAVVAVGIGAALYAALSAVAIPIGPNTSFRIAIVLLPIFGAFFGPIAGFLIGFIGHALNDAFMYGGVWWSWVFMSAMLGFFGGFVRADKKFDPLNGVCTKINLLGMYILAAVGMFVGSIMAYFGDVYLYGEPAEKLFIQITMANISNLLVIFVIGIPAVAIIARSRAKTNGLMKEK
jgi:energy-coupling factor transport system substrate-specific component